MEVLLMLQPLLVTAAIIIKEDQILLARNRSCIYGPDTWGFPAGTGGFKKTSNPYLAVCQEVRGDVGCEFKGEFFMLNYFEPPGKLPTVTIFYRGEIKGTPVPVCGDVIEAKYFPMENARELKLKYDHNKILEQLIKNYK